MPNEQFLSRWPKGRGTGYIAYCWSLRAPLARTGPLCYQEHQFEPLAVQVSNTSLDNGNAEAWSLSGPLAGPMFLHESDVFDSEAEVIVCINATMQAAIDSKLRQIQAIELEIAAINARKIPSPSDAKS